MTDFSNDQRLSRKLSGLAATVRHTELTLGELMSRLGGRVYTLLLVLLSLPFCQPVALPGLSTPFGMIFALLGVRFAFHKKPWLPDRLIRTRLPARFLPNVLQGGARLLGWLELILRPRGETLFEYRITRMTTGLVICACGLLLLLPVPVPFSNLLPAITVVFVASSYSEKDAVILAVGGVLFLITLAFFALIFLGGVEVIGWLESRFASIFAASDG